PALPISPTWTRVETAIDTPLKKTLYANSITLTPGTLTTNAHEDHLVVHALAEENITELRKGEMEGRIRKLVL
ncbi:MAG: Na+/H+ antiporter subunit E, partial [Planctomycetota bacterium]